MSLNRRHTSCFPGLCLHGMYCLLAANTCRQHSEQVIRRSEESRTFSLGYCGQRDAGLVTHVCTAAVMRHMYVIIYLKVTRSK